jgi:hypothetical protein
MHCRHQYDRARACNFSKYPINAFVRLYSLTGTGNITVIFSYTKMGRLLFSSFSVE